jgi:hypothetical protein
MRFIEKQPPVKPMGNGLICGTIQDKAPRWARSIEWAPDEITKQRLFYVDDGILDWIIV